MMQVSLLTGGGDRPYVIGLASALIKNGLDLEIIGSDELESPAWHVSPRVRFLNLRGNQKVDASLPAKISRMLIYYARLIRYAWSARPEIFHILWNNKFEFFDRTLLMLYYKTLGKRVTLTAHNVNQAKRDYRDSFFNRLTLKFQYRLCDHIFVHTEQMKNELVSEFGCTSSAITVIPLGINNAVPQTPMGPVEARQRLAISEKDKTILFFGYIAPYKGLEYLIEAFRLIMIGGEAYRLVIAGNPKQNCRDYLKGIQESLNRHPHRDRIFHQIAFIPDAETEVYFKAADVVVLPYRHIFQSGVLVLSYSFGVPVIASDVGELREDIVEGKTGFICRSENSADLARVIQKYFSSELYRELSDRRHEIRDYASRRYSWNIIGDTTANIYKELQGMPSLNRDHEVITR